MKDPREFHHGEEMEPFDELKVRLEGKTILRIEEIDNSEAICRFVLSDGTEFNLYATELGFWIKEV